MHELHFAKLFPIADWKELVSITYGWEACTESAKIYGQNIQLMHTIAMVPGYAFMNGETWGYAVDRAMNELKSTNPDDPAVAKLASKHWDAYDLQGFPRPKINHFYEATANAEKMASLLGRDMSHGALHGLLKSILIQAWTAFEVLAEDLHCGARKKHPECFPSNIRSAKGYQFRSLRSLKESYKAFGDDSNINAVTESKQVKALAVLRHLLVHRNGIVDQTFLNQCSESPVVTSFSAFAANQQVLITGSMVRLLVDPTVRLGFKLIKLVDEWMTSRKPK